MLSILLFIFAVRGTVVWLLIIIKYPSKENLLTTWIIKVKVKTLKGPTTKVKEFTVFPVVLNSQLNIEYLIYYFLYKIQENELGCLILWFFSLSLSLYIVFRPVKIKS